MIKRIIRYTLLVLTLLLAGVWVWSYRRVLVVEYKRTDRYVVVSCASGYCSISIDTATRWPAAQSSRWKLTLRPNDRIWISHFMFVDNVPGDFFLNFPLWIPFTPLALATAAMWYRPIRDWRRQRHQRGFPVEMDKEDKGVM